MMIALSRLREENAKLRAEIARLEHQHKNDEAANVMLSTICDDQSKLIAGCDARTRASMLGQPKYEGMACKHGHGGMRYTSTGGCVDCHCGYPK